MSYLCRNLYLHFRCFHYNNVEKVHSRFTDLLGKKGRLDHDASDTIWVCKTDISTVSTGIDVMIIPMFEAGRLSSMYP